MNVDCFNDTLDNYTFSTQIQNELLKANIDFNSFNGTSTKISQNSNVVENCEVISKNDITFDDSIFISTCDIDQISKKLLAIEQAQNLPKNAEIQTIQTKEIVHNFAESEKVSKNEEFQVTLKIKEVQTSLKNKTHNLLKSKEVHHLHSREQSLLKTRETLNKNQISSQQEQLDNVIISPDSDIEEFDLTNSIRSNSTPKNNSTFVLSKVYETQTKTDENKSKPLMESSKLQIDGSLRQLDNWGLPLTIVEKYKKKNIKEMFLWQVECLNRPNILQKNCNLVYSAPTSAGKTLIAEILTIKTVLEREKKVIFILPFVSVVREKMFYFQEILGSSGVRVEGFMGSYNPPGGFTTVQVAICTIEKANSLINKLLLEGNLREIGAVVIDEMHLLGDPSRGYLLELLLTKLKYVTAKDESIKIQIVGMSATLPNLEMLAKWLNAELYITDFRPIPLYELAQVCGEIYNNNLKLIRRLEPIPDLETDTDNILQLCLETVIDDSCSVLIFCPTKNWCENLAQQIALAFYKLGNCKSKMAQDLRQQLKVDLIGELLEQLKYCPVGLDEVLKKSICFGVAFHHAGLTMDERDIIEAGFRNGAVRVLVATSTLSSGVNLPAKRVIIRTPIFNGKPLDPLTYRQMIGRAGRMGKDTSGESILVCQKNDQKIASALLSATLQPIESCLIGAGKLKRAILEIVASGIASSPQDLKLFAQSTLLAQTEFSENPIDETVEFLTTNEFIRLQEENNDVKYVATSLGKACLSSSIPPEDGLALFTELEKARQCFVLETELHLIYLVTPYSACHQWSNLDWMFYLNLWEKLPASMKRVGDLVGVRESYIISATRGKLQTNTSKLYHRFLVHKRFFVALALQDLVNEKSLNEVCAKFNCNRGMLQSLQLSASTFAGMVTAFSRQLGWSSVELLISQFQDRLQFGVSRDLLDLMKLPILNGKSARALYDGGLETLVQLANSDINTIENILHRVIPFETNKAREGETEFQLKERNKFKNIWITGKEGLTEREAAELILENARRFLEMELGLKDAKWDKTQNDNRKSPIATTKNLSSTSMTTNQENDLRSTSDNSLFENSVGNENDQNFSNQHLILSKISYLNDSSIQSLNSSGDVITTSQDYQTFEDKLKLTLSTKKRSCLDLDDSLLSSPRKKTRISENARKHLEFEFAESVPLKSFEIVNINNNELYNEFCKEIKGYTELSISIACSAVEYEKVTIGIKNKSDRCEARHFTFKNRKVDGFGICWGGDVVYYLNLEMFEKGVELVEKVLENKQMRIRMFDCKEQLKVLKKCCDLNFNASFEDPKVADWLLFPEEEEKTLQGMVSSFCGKFSELIQIIGPPTSVRSVGLNLHSLIQSKLRSCTEALINWYLVDSIKNHLKNQNPKLIQIFDTEMKTISILINMELYGIETNKEVLEQNIETIRQQILAIEKKAFSLAGKRFNFSSSRQVAQILRMTKSKKISTRKQLLEKNEHPISKLVLEWRKLSCIITKTIQPLVRSITDNRICGCYIFHTATGRISMHEPNLQNVAKNFEITDCSTGNPIIIKCRNGFVAKRNYVLLSADYCQLELRLLTHFSKDKILCKIMKHEGDVFKAIAAKWNNIPEDQVDDNLRQNAKKLCYAIIYGMGSKALSEQLGIEEKDATIFMETFRNSYPGIKNYIKETIANCRNSGFVQTLAGRKRYLPHINDKNLNIKTQAERQAVNTTIQGSAADLIKRVMVVLDQKFSTMNSNDRPNMVLHLHDELLYEVPQKNFKKIACIIKSTMEEAVKLSIPFPVKVKSGITWGELEELKL